MWRCEVPDDFQLIFNLFLLNCACVCVCVRACRPCVSVVTWPRVEPVNVGEGSYLDVGLR